MSEAPSTFQSQPRELGRRPRWLRVRLPGGPEYAEVRRTLRRLGLHTVCVEAACPNLGECWGRRSLTLMILGDRCSRGCRFCNVQGRPTGPPDPAEPERVAQALATLELRHAVVTSVTRDDLPDGGAAHWAATLRAVREVCPGLTMEALVPDFQGDKASVDVVLSARPDVFAHNLETVRRLTPAVRPRASYQRSLEVLRHAGARGALTKSGLMAGLGESLEELREALVDLREAGVQLVTVGQYLQPTRLHLPVARYLSPQEFDALGEYALALGFVHVAAGPLVRSSYHADEAVRRAAFVSNRSDPDRPDPGDGAEDPR